MDETLRRITDGMTFPPGCHAWVAREKATGGHRADGTPVPYEDSPWILCSTCACDIGQHHWRD